MGEAFRIGGWGMYPTTVFGLVLVYCAVRYAAAPDAKRALLVRRLSLLTFLSGCLGFIAGTIRSFLAAGTAEGDIGTHVVHGVGESLTNIGLSVGLLVLANILMAIGAARRVPGTEAELADPHRP